MKKAMTFTVILIMITHCLFGQMDSIKSQIMHYEESKSSIISKGRRLLLDKFVEGDINKVKEIKDYLIDIEDDNYLTFYTAEYWFILYWTNDYIELAEDIQHFDASKIENDQTKIAPLNDKLYEKLLDKTFEFESQIKERIQNAELDEETKQILTLNLEYLLIDKRDNIYAQDGLNDKADDFIKTFPSTKFEGFTKKYIRYKLVPKNWGITFEFFSGYGIYTGNLSQNYTNNVPIGVAFDVCYKNWELYLRDYIGFNSTKKDVDYSLGTWEEGSRSMVVFPEASLGYVVYNDNKFKISPFAGIAGMDISPISVDIDKTPELKEVSLEFTTTYLAGINFDLKFGPKNIPAFNPKASYAFMRLRYAYGATSFEKKYVGMAGNMHYITIGLGVMARGLKRTD